MWSCKSCTFLNDLSTFPICEACQTDNDAPVSVKTNTWACSQCTFDNSVNRTDCSVCGNKQFDVSNATTISNSNELTVTKPKLDRLLSTIVTSLSAAQRQEKDEIDAACQFIDIVHGCQEKRVHFLDDDFIPSSRSIDNESTTASEYEWLPIREISSSDNDSKLPWTVMSNPQPHDIQQGTLGDCWFLAALALITERPSMLSRILLTSTVNEEGVYLVRICYNGWWRIVILDDCFPCTEQKQLAFAKPIRRQLFAPLIEKAYAKVCGCYASLTGGFMAESLNVLTGAPSEDISLQTPTTDDNDHTDLLWIKLVSAWEAKLLMGAHTANTNVPDEEYERVCLPRTHMYSVIACHDLSPTERFVLIRNPHNYSGYKEDSISAETRKELQRLKQANAENGFFWMSWLAFQKFFHTLTICSYRAELFDVRFEGEFTRHAAQTIQSYYFQLERSTTITVSLFRQYNTRRKKAFHHTQMFLLCDIVDNQIGQRLALHCSTSGNHNEWTGTLPTGAYILIPFSTSFWHRQRNENDTIKYTLVIHSSLQLEVMVTEELGKVLADCLIADAVKHNTILVKTNEFALYRCEPNNGLVFVVGENTSTTHSINVTIDASESSNIRHSRNSMIIFDSIPICHRQLHLLYEYVTVNNQSSSFGCTVTYQPTEAGRQPSKPAINRIDDIHAPRPILF